MPHTSISKYSSEGHEAYDILWKQPALNATFRRHVGGVPRACLDLTRPSRASGGRDGRCRVIRDAAQDDGCFGFLYGYRKRLAGSESGADGYTACEECGRTAQQWGKRMRPGASIYYPDEQRTARSLGRAAFQEVGGRFWRPVAGVDAPLAVSALAVRF